MERDNREGGGYSLGLEGGENGKVTLSVSGTLGLGNLKAAMADLRTILKGLTPSEIIVDLEGLEYLDSAGAVALMKLREVAEVGSAPSRFTNVGSRIKRIMDLLDPEAIAAEPIIAQRGAEGFFAEVGETSRRLFIDLKQLIAFLGELLFVFGYAVKHPRSVRWGEVLFYMKRAGVDGLPIVGLVNFLLGFVVAIMAADQLIKYEFTVFLGSLVAIAMVKMFGPMMTAIFLASRTGSAYAAEIGTMVVDEEVNALISMGFEPTRFLALPKILAMVLVLPLLVLYADLLGIVGGLFVATAKMGMPSLSYFSQIPNSISVFDLLWSLLKTAVFAVIIGVVGCQKGFKVRGGAEEVGSATTSAAVTSIFLIIVVDTLFALLSSYI